VGEAEHITCTAGDDCPPERACLTGCDAAMLRRGDVSALCGSEIVVR
jgi:hypothetical protein